MAPLLSLSESQCLTIYYNAVYSNLYLIIGICPNTHTHTKRHKFSTHDDMNYTEVQKKSCCHIQTVLFSLYKSLSMN